MLEKPISKARLRHYAKEINIRYDRAQIEEMFKKRSNDIRQTLGDVLTEMEQGVVNVAVFELITEENIRMNTEIITGLKGIHDSMEEAAEIHQRLEHSVKEVLSAAALATVPQEKKNDCTKSRRVSTSRKNRSAGS